MITDMSTGAPLYKIEQSPTSHYEKRVHRSLPGGRYNVIATISRKGWWGKWQVLWTHNDNFTTLSPSWFGYECSFEHGGIEYTWTRYSKLMSANGNQVASITWNLSEGTLRVEEEGWEMLEIILSTAMATKCHWGKYSNTNSRYNDPNHQFVRRPGDPIHDEIPPEQRQMQGNGFRVGAQWRGAV